jgi:hypothetical protein
MGDSITVRTLGYCWDCGGSCRGHRPISNEGDEMMISVDGCHEDGSLPPREGCRCRACYFSREDQLNDDLSAFLKEMFSTLSGKTIVSSPIIWKWMQSYLNGNVSLDAAQVGMLKDLVEQNERLFSELSLALNLKPLINLAVP